MTKITIFRNHDGEYLGFDCLGHAGYADAVSYTHLTLPTTPYV